MKKLYTALMIAGLALACDPLAHADEGDMAANSDAAMMEMHHGPMGGEMMSGPMMGMPGPEHAMMGDKMIEQMKEKLSLSDEQVSKMKDIAKASMEGMKAQGQKMKEDFQNLKKLVDSNAADADLTAAVDQLKADRKAMQAAHEKMMDSMGDVLTPMQRAKAVLAMGARMQQGMEKWKKMKEQKQERKAEEEKAGDK